jgi:hypothetical protein
MERLVWSSRGATHVLTRDKHASTTLLIKKMISRRENYQITLHISTKDLIAKHKIK